MKIYIDPDYKCHVSSDGTMREFDVESLDGKCPAYIEGCRYVPIDESWTRPDGHVFDGEMFTLWRDSRLLEKFQAQYDAQLAAAAAAIA